MFPEPSLQRVASSTGHQEDPCQDQSKGPVQDVGLKVAFVGHVHLRQEPADMEGQGVSVLEAQVGTGGYQAAPRMGNTEGGQATARVL